MSSVGQYTDASMPSRDVEALSVEVDRLRAACAEKDAKIEGLKEDVRIAELNERSKIEATIEEKMRTLRELALAYMDADDNDYCTDAYPKCEGLRPDEIADAMIREIRAATEGKNEPENTGKTIDEFCSSCTSGPGTDRENCDQCREFSHYEEKNDAVGY